MGMSIQVRWWRPLARRSDGALLVAAFAVVALLTVGVGSASAATLNVCPSGCTYTTIPAALAAANNGDTIQIKASGVGLKLPEHPDVRVMNLIETALIGRHIFPRRPDTFRIDVNADNSPSPAFGGKNSENSRSGTDIQKTFELPSTPVDEDSHHPCCFMQSCSKCRNGIQTNHFLTMRSPPVGAPCRHNPKA